MLPDAPGLRVETWASPMMELYTTKTGFIVVQPQCIFRDQVIPAKKEMQRVGWITTGTGPYFSFQNPFLPVWLTGGVGLLLRF